MVDEARERPGVLIVSASMGGGHDGAARELARRLEERGERPIVVDFLDAFPLAIGRLLRRVYRLQLGGASWSYDASYWLAARVRIVYQPMVILFALLTGRSLRRAIERERPSAVVSTYPFSSLVLGRGRLRGWLKVPLVTFVTDFAVHPLWAHKGADLHLCVHQSSARRASMLSGGRAVATGPMVPPRFAARDVGKAEARERLGLPRDRQLALVVAGAWGLGDVTSTFDALLRGGRYVPVAVCGTNDRLRRTLEERGQGVVLGWTDEMPLLMAACDVLVQNAGGLSCMEAFAAGLPVVTYRPVAGHGRHNGRDMALAGVAHLVVGDDQLLATLDRATTLAGRGHVAAGRALFSSDPADLVMAVRGAPAPSRPATGALPGRVRRLAGGAAISVAAAYLGLNLVADAAVAHGLDTVKVDHYGNEVFVAIRLGPASVGDAQVTALLGGEGVTAVLSGRLVREDASAVRQMSFDGVDLADGGWGRPSTLHVVQPSSGVISSLHAFHQVLGKAPIDLVPPRAVNGIDLVSALVEHVPIVRAVHELTPAQVGPPGQSGTVPLRARAIYVIDASTSNGAAVTATLWRLQAAAAAAHLATAPLVDAG